MSLPSVVIFYKEDQEVSREFINCGWICNDKTIASGIKRSLIGKTFDWDTAKAYGKKFTKKEII